MPRNTIYLRTNKRSYQKRCEDCKEGPKTQNNRVPNSLIEDSFALKEAALSYTSSFSCHIVLLWEFERGACWRRRRCHTEKKESYGSLMKGNWRVKGVVISLFIFSYYNWFYPHICHLPKATNGARMIGNEGRYLCINISVQVWKSN